MHHWWKGKLVQLLWKTVWMFLKKLKTELPYKPAIPLLDIYLKKTKILTQKGGKPLKKKAILLFATT